MLAESSNLFLEFDQELSETACRLQSQCSFMRFHISRGATCGSLLSRPGRGVQSRRSLSDLALRIDRAKLILFNLSGLNSPIPWGESWLKASGLKSAVNTPLLAAGY